MNAPPARGKRIVAQASERVPRQGHGVAEPRYAACPDLHPALKVPPGSVRASAAPVWPLVLIAGLAVYALIAAERGGTAWAGALIAVLPLGALAYELSSKRYFARRSRRRRWPRIVADRGPLEVRHGCGTACRPARIVRPPATRDRRRRARAAGR